MRGLVRKNNKNNVISYEHSIKKSNELSMAKMNRGLTLNQIQLFAYAIYSTQQDGKTDFRKHEFEKKFNIEQLRPNDAMDDAYRLLDLKIQMKDMENEKSRGHNVFTDYFYDRGQFSFNWNANFIPHILELKEKYIITDLNITSKFKSGFSWILYDYLKAHYGYWYLKLSKKDFMTLFCVDDVKSYQKNTSVFKNKVLNVAVEELNKYTELEVWYTDLKEGRSIAGFELHWSIGERTAGATEKQLTLLRAIHDEVDKKMFDYISLKDTEAIESARKNIVKIKEINGQVNDRLTSEKAKDLIWETKMLYEQLQNLLEKDGKTRDTSVYFNWLEGE